MSQNRHTTNYALLALLVQLPALTASSKVIQIATHRRIGWPMEILIAAPPPPPPPPHPHLPIGPFSCLIFLVFQSKVRKCPSH